MKRIGNTESNKTYNPRNVKPQIPIDIDEVDSALERYIRQKYEQRIYMHDTRLGTRQNTGSTSSEDRPPPLPPKPTGRFGFGLRKAATSPRDLTPPLSPGLGGFNHDTSPPHVNKPSRVFGSNIQQSGDGLEAKLATLRDMGFPDEKRNSTVLKGLNGNLDRTVEALIRLGEQNPARSRGSTPTPPAKSSANGLSFDRSNTAPATTTSNNPFDALDAIAPTPQQPQQTQQQMYEASFAQTASSSNSYNPFLNQVQQMQYQQQQSIPQQQQQQQQQQHQQNYNYQQNPFGQQQGLEQSLQNMQISNQQPQQPLFPNRTGGYGPTQPPLAQTNPFQQSFTPPPMPQIPEQYSSFFAPQPQPQYQSMSSPSSPGNPFLKSSRSQMFSPTSSTNSNPFGQQQAQQQPASNPYMTMQQNQTSTIQASNPWQSQQPSQFQQQQNPYQPSYQHQQNLQQSGFQQQNQQQQNLYQQNQQQQNFQQQGFQQHNQQPSGIQQNANPFDKNSILSLYNYPQLAPQPSEQSQAASAPPAAVISPVPASGHMNPFTSGQNGQQGQPLSAAQTPGVRHVSNESVDFAGLMGGRHSPDAFSGLSASFRR
jgi:hypothetical protein